MPAGQVIGRISVKVLPDTSDFKRKAQADLDKIEDKLELVIRTKADMSGASRDYLEALKEINKRNKQMDSRKIRFYTRISTEGMQKAVRDAAKELTKRAENERVDFKVGDIRAVGDIQLQLDQQNLDDVKDQIKKWRDDVSPVTVDVHLNIPTGTAAGVSAHLAYLTRPRSVPIVPHLDQAAVARVGAALAALSGARVLENLFRRVADSLKNLDKSVPIVGTLATALMGLAAAGLTASSNLFALSASLAQIGPLALLLPGLLGGLVVGLGVSAVAFSDFNKRIPEVKNSLSELKTVISDNFWAPAEEPIRRFVDDLLPRVEAGVARTATQLGDFFGGFAESLQGALNPALAQMFKDLSESINIATGGTDAFANIITVLAKVGTSYLPELAQWFVNISKRFSNFLTQAEEDGSLKQWIDTGIQNLKDLFRALSNIGGILTGISRAAAEGGGASLGMFADTLERIHQVVDSPGFQVGLAGAFEGAHRAMSNIANSSGPAVEDFFTTFARLLETTLPQVGTIIGTALGAVASALAQPEIVNGISALFDGIQAAVEALAPALMPVGRALGTLMDVVGVFAAMLGPLVAAAITPLAVAFEALLPSLIPIIELLGGALTQAIEGLSPLIHALVPAVQGLLGGAFELLAALLPPVVALLLQAANVMGPVITQVADQLTPILPVLGEALGGLLTALAPLSLALMELNLAVLQPLIPVITQILTDCIPPLAESLARLAEALIPIITALTAIISLLMIGLAPALEFVIGIFAGSLIGAINGVALALEGIVEIFRGFWNILVGVFQIGWGLFEGLFTGNWDRFKQGWVTLWNGIWEFLQGIWDTILGAALAFLNIGIIGLFSKGLTVIKGLWNAGWTAVKNFGTTVWNAIRGSFDDFGSRLGSIASGAINRIKDFFTSGWNNIKSATLDAFRAVRDTIKTWIGKAVDEVKKIPDRVRDGIGDLGNVLRNAGIALIQGFINGIGSMFDNVRDTLGNLTDMLPDLKGPASKDRVLLYENGQLVIDGFVHGLESRYDAVRKSLRGLTEDVARTEFTVPGAEVESATGISSALAAAIDGSPSAVVEQKILNYYAAENNSLDAEEDLFAASDRARFGWG